MPELPANLVPIVLTIAIAALLTVATGTTVKIAGNELGAKGTTSRVATLVLGLVLIAWSVWSLRTKSFEVVEVRGSRVDLVRPDRNNCPTEAEVAALVRFAHAPGKVRYEVRLGDGIAIKTFTQKIDQSGSGSDLLGPTRIRLPSRHPVERFDPRVVIVSPTLINHKMSRPFRSYVMKSARECGV